MFSCSVSHISLSDPFPLLVLSASLGRMLLVSRSPVCPFLRSRSMGSSIHTAACSSAIHRSHSLLCILNNTFSLPTLNRKCIMNGSFGYCQHVMARNRVSKSFAIPKGFLVIKQYIKPPCRGKAMTQNSRRVPRWLQLISYSSLVLTYALTHMLELHNNFVWIARDTHSERSHLERPLICWMFSSNLIAQPIKFGDQWLNGSWMSGRCLYAVNDPLEIAASLGILTQFYCPMFQPIANTDPTSHYLMLSALVFTWSFDCLLIFRRNPFYQNTDNSIS